MVDSSFDGSGDGSPLDEVVDDTPAQDHGVSWAIDELAGGRGLEEVTAELVANGWTTDEAEEICEIARQRTRNIRGVTTRQDVARAYSVGDPKVLRGISGLVSHGLFIGTLVNLARAVLRVMSGRRMGRRAK